MFEEGAAIAVGKVQKGLRVKVEYVKEDESEMACAAVGGIREERALGAVSDSKSVDYEKGSNLVASLWRTCRVRILLAVVSVTMFDYARLSLSKL